MAIALRDDRCNNHCMASEGHPPKTTNQNKPEQTMTKMISKSDILTRDAKDFVEVGDTIDYETWESLDARECSAFREELRRLDLDDRDVGGHIEIVEAV